MTYDPQKHLIELKSKNGPQKYLPVQARLVWFRELCPHGTIDIEEVAVDLDREVEAEAFVWNPEKRRSEKVIKRGKGYARYRATVTDGQGGRAMGTKSENGANFPDFIEKAETGAIGRALAALGYGTQFTGDELAEGDRIVDAPVTQPEPAPTEETQPASTPAATSAQPAIPAQKQRIIQLSKAAGRAVPDLSGGLTFESAAKMIAELSAMAKRSA